MQIKKIGEIGLIKRIARHIKCDRSVIRGIGDDAAVIRWTRDKHLLFTCDMLVEDVHFRRKSATPYQIGWKSLGRNLSDIAAMGGVARYAVVSVGISPEASVGFADGIAKGIKDLARKFGVNIVGGDTVRSRKIVIDISMLGEVEKNKAAFRSGANVGDAIFVTGSLGGSIRGKHLNFMPRVNEARKLVNNFKINSMIDISDGLILDLWRVLDASKAGARIYEDLIPVSGDAPSFRKAITDGEDFELLFTMDAREARRLLKTTPANMRISAALIGEITGRRDGFVLVNKYGKEERLKPEGYVHF